MDVHVNLHSIPGNIHMQLFFLKEFTQAIVLNVNLLLNKR